MGIWSVKPGKGKEFVSLWNGFAKWTAKSQKAAGRGVLLQDADNPLRFVSFGSWKDEKGIAAWRSRPEFREFLEKARALCDEIKPGKLEEVASA